MSPRALRYPYERRSSAVFGDIHRPVISVEFYSLALRHWIAYTMIADTGADYTILPVSAALHLGVSLGQCERHSATGIGGQEMIYLHRAMRLRLGTWERIVPVGFSPQKNVPPLLGRYQCLDTFDLRFCRFVTSLAGLTQE